MKVYILAFLLVTLSVVSLPANAEDSLHIETDKQSDDVHNNQHSKHLRGNSKTRLRAFSKFFNQHSTRSLQYIEITETCEPGCRAILGRTNTCSQCQTYQNCEQPQSERNRNGVTWCADGCKFDHHGFYWKIWQLYGHTGCEPDCTVKSCTNRPGGSSTPKPTPQPTRFPTRNPTPKPSTAPLVRLEQKGSNKVKVTWSKSYFTTSKVEICRVSINGGNRTPFCREKSRGSGNWNDNNDLENGVKYRYKVCTVPDTVKSCVSKTIEFE